MMNLETMHVPNVPHLTSGMSIESSMSEATHEMLMKYAKMVEDTHQHNQSVLSQANSIASEKNYISGSMTNYEDELDKMKSDLMNLKTAESQLLEM
jgi:ribosomal protein S17E